MEEEGPQKCYGCFILNFLINPLGTTPSSVVAIGLLLIREYQSKEFSSRSLEMYTIC